MLKLDEVVAEIEKSEKPFYVYILYKPNGTPFYVGKGTKITESRYDERVASHEWESKHEAPPSRPYRNEWKINTIKKIWREGGDVLYKLDSWHDAEETAYECEKSLIAMIGRKVTGDGPLTNLLEGGEKKIASLPGDVRERISDSLKAYYLNNPEKLQEMSDRAAEYFSNPENRERARQNSTENNTAEYIRNWLATVDPEVLAEKHEKHSEFMKEWHSTDEGKEKTKQAASKRNEKLRTDEHRRHMAGKTKEYIENNRESFLAARAKAKEWAAERAKLRQECFNLVRDKLFAEGKSVRKDGDATSTMLYKWRQKGWVGDDVPNGSSASIEDWQIFKLKITERLMSCELRL